MPSIRSPSIHWYGCNRRLPPAMVSRVTASVIRSPWTAPPLSSARKLRPWAIIWLRVLPMCSPERTTSGLKSRSLPPAMARLMTASATASRLAERLSLSARRTLALMGILPRARHMCLPNRVEIGARRKNYSPLTAPPATNSAPRYLSRATPLSSALSNCYTDPATLIFENSTGTWTQTAKLTASDGSGAFGDAVRLDGNNALIGAQLTGIGGNMDQGAAFIFTIKAALGARAAHL